MPQLSKIVSSSMLDKLFSIDSTPKQKQIMLLLYDKPSDCLLGAISAWCDNRPTKILCGVIANSFKIYLLLLKP